MLNTVFLLVFLNTVANKLDALINLLLALFAGNKHVWIAQKPILVIDTVNCKLCRA